MPLLLLLSPRLSFAQAPTPDPNNSVWCDSSCNTTSINCAPNYVVPQVCELNPYNCCRNFVIGLTCPQFIACVTPYPTSTPVPTSPPGTPPPLPTGITPYPTVIPTYGRCDFTTGRNCFSCEYDPGVGCFANPVHNTYPPYGCTQGYEVNNSVCSSITDFSTCQGTVNQDCILTPNPDLIGFYYAGLVASSCQPCYSWNAIPNDPLYIPQCDPPQFTSGDACNCINFPPCDIPPRYRCNDELICEITDVGPYESLSGCEAECGTPPLFCDEFGNPTSSPTDRLSTAIGCIPISNTTAFVGFFIRWSLGLGGGIAFFLIVYAGFMIITSGGDSKKIAAGRELLTSAISGIVLIIFSVFVLEMLGVRILNLPGLSSPF